MKFGVPCDAVQSYCLAQSESARPRQEASTHNVAPCCCLSSTKLAFAPASFAVVFRDARPAALLAAFLVRLCSQMPDPPLPVHLLLWRLCGHFAFFVFTASPLALLLPTSSPCSFPLSRFHARPCPQVEVSKDQPGQSPLFAPSPRSVA